MNQEYDLAIVCALGLERKFLEKLLFSPKRHSDFSFPFISGACGTSRELRICLIQCGVGPANAAKNLTDVLEQVQVKHILIAGLCGSLSTRFRIGDLLIPQTILSTDNAPEISCDSFFNTEQNNHSGEILLSSNQPVTTVASREKWHAQTAAVGVDMETYSLAETARQRDIKFSVIRAVSDDVQTELDSRFIHLLKDSGEPNILKVLVSIVSSPVLLLALYAMYFRANIAMDFMMKYLEQNDLASIV